MKCEFCKKIMPSDDAITRRIGGKTIAFCGNKCLGEYLSHVREWLFRNRPTGIGGAHARKR